MPQPNPRYRSAALLSATLLLLAACHRGGKQEEKAAPAARAASATVAVQPSFVAVTDQALAQPAGDNWLSYGGGFANQRYSTLDQLNTSNVSDLALAWMYSTGLAESFETTPVVAGNVMFLTTPESHVVALNAATGDRLWEFVPPLGRAFLCCGPNNRGVAAYGDRVYVGTIDAHLFALDQRTGQIAWEAAVADSADAASSITMAPLAYEGRVFVGVAGGEFGVRGRVLAFDAGTGAPLWRFNTVPDPGTEGQANGWFGHWLETDPFGTPLNRDINAEKASISSGTYASYLHGGGGVYTTPAYDPATATLYFCVGNPSPDLDGSARGGDNLFTGSVVALDARTGRLKWYFQEVPHDLWNLSPASPPFLFDAGGHRYLAQAGKTGWLYVVDAATGRPVLRSDNFVPQENLFSPPTDAGVRMSPGPNGGAGWAPAAFSRRTSLAYVQAVHQPTVYTRSPTPRETGSLWLGGSFRYLPGEPQWGTISAIDPSTGQISWQRQTPRPNFSGLLATAGDLLFAGEADGNIDAFDARSGDVLWQYPTGAGVSGGVVTYAVDGVQYVAVAAGGDAQLGTRPGDNVYAFALRSRIPRRAVTNYPEPRYARGGPLRAQAAAGAASPVQPPTTSPATPPPATTTAGAPAPGQPAAPTTTTAPTTTAGVAPGAPTAPRPPVRHRPTGPRILGKPIPNPTPPRR